MDDWSDRLALLDQNLIGPDHDGVPTLWDSFLRGYSLAGSSSQCLGTRLTWDWLAHHSGKPRLEYQWLSYAQVFTKIRALSVGFMEIFGPSSSTSTDLSSIDRKQKDYLNKPRLAIWCSSSLCWTISEYAAYRNSIAVVSINDQSAAKTASEIIQATHPDAIILNTHNFRRLIVHRDRWRQHHITTSQTQPHHIEFQTNSLLLTEDGSSSQGGKPMSRKTLTIHSNAAELPSSDTPEGKALDGSHNSDKFLATSASARQDSLLTFEPIYIITDPLRLSSQTRAYAIELGLTFFSFEEVEGIGHDRIQMSLSHQAPHESLGPDEILESEKSNIFRPEPKTIAAIVYSSGTTGDPKPCVLTHGNFAANLAAFNYLVERQHLKDLHTQDLIQFSYLPLFHIYEKQTQAYVLNRGGSIGYSSLESPRLLEDLSILKPTFIATTPNFLTHQILDRRLQFLNNFSSFKNPVEAYLLNKAIDQKLKMLKSGFGENIWLWDRFVLGYLRDQLGGRLKWIVSGTSPISKDVAELLSASLSVKISEGYGLTETCGAACIAIDNGTHDFQVGHVGPPLPCCQIKLEKVDGLAKTQNKFHEGMIYIRGHNVFLGYLVPRTPTTVERIESVIDSEGWLPTGDIGYFDDRGRLHLTDRLLTFNNRSWSTFPQQIHHRFNLIDLVKIERGLFHSTPEISQIFISGRLENTHAEVGMGQLGNLVGFIVLEQRAFMRWIAHSRQLNHQLVTHAQDDDDDQYHRLGIKDTIQIDPITDREWELIDKQEELIGATRNLTIEGGCELSRERFDQTGTETKSSTSDSARTFSSHHHGSNFDKISQSVEVDNMCRDPLIIKSFIQYLRQRGKAIGLKLYEMPQQVYLSTERFELDSEDRTSASPAPTSRPRSKSPSHDNPFGSSESLEEALDLDPSIRPNRDNLRFKFLSLNHKNSRLINHFCS